MLMMLSGGMKCRVLIGKAPAHEPTAGMDMELRRMMWTQVQRLRVSRVTIILTVYYIYIERYQRIRIFDSFCCKIGKLNLCRLIN